ncbi:histidine kinase [Xylaria bambusicola]|uniref:histidine kinase n=1 Tax=Xylaria bambusicola TaxID=326684 RepID=UPI002007A0A7|nr:histidine kinase [Xylaria bambusicola]KAI0521539.1 histidine kinase [Xylaria bambusicola]
MTRETNPNEPHNPAILGDKSTTAPLYQSFTSETPPVNPIVFTKAIREYRHTLATDAHNPKAGRAGELATENGHYGLIPTVSNAHILHQTKKTACIGDDADHSHEGISTASQKSPRLQSAHTKRLPEGEAGEKGTNPPIKKQRVRLSPPRQIDLSSFSKPILPPKVVDGLTSPLFFSHRQKPFLVRPLGYTGLEATTMLKTVRDGTEVTTLKLARGTVNAASPARSSSTPGSWSSIEAATLSRSPDTQASVPGLQVLQGVGILELLEQDDRPTFIVDSLNPVNNTPSGPFSILYANPALHVSDSIRQLVYGDFQDNQDGRAEFDNFRSWIKSGGNPTGSQETFLPSYHYGGVSWTCYTLRNRFRFVSANTTAASIGRASPEPLLERDASFESRSRGLTPIAQPQTPSDVAIQDRDYFGDVGDMGTDSQVQQGVDNDVGEPMVIHRSHDFIPAALVSLPQPSFDWTRIPLTPDLPHHIHFARTRDWASTSLGPMEEWSSELRTISNLVMGSPHPAALYWGRDFTVIYNEAYVAVAGRKHPELMGSRYQDLWSEIWHEIQPVFESAWESGQATMKNDDRMFLRRAGFNEETYFSWSIVPLVGEDGNVVGLYNPAFENTRRKIAERMMLTLREVGEKTAIARDVKSFWSQVNKGLEYNEDDVPFNLVYSVVEDQESDICSMHSGSWMNPPQLNLEASLGVPPEHPCLVGSLDLKTSNEGFAPYMRESMSNHGRPVTLSSEQGTLPEGLMDGFHLRGGGEPCRSIVIFPVHPTTGSESVVGFIVMGINPRRPYDEDYQLFINLLSRQLATSLASVVLFEEEIRRGQRAAQMALRDRQELTEQLHIRTREVEESELKFTRMAEFAPVGMFIADQYGRITYSNDMWWDISRHNRSESVNSWMQSVKDEDRPALEAVWRQLVSEKVAITHEFRFKCARHEGGVIIDTWVLMSAYPEKDIEGGIKGIFGCITNISQQKLAEQIQMHRREEAVELKRQQENFIDITSHEMRNPLSAILQCADEISGTLSTYSLLKDEASKSENLKLALAGCLEAANTISLCASHQKRIVDDILTLSKLDSQLLLVTPVDVQPMAVVQRVLKMFEGELNTNGIEMKFQVKNRYIDMGIDWVKLDPSRLLQVLINLMTNAIKFTQSHPKRSIVVTLDASTDISDITDSGVAYFQSDRSDQDDLTNQRDWGTGEKINLLFSVQDTGRGLDEHERKLLFQRFSQATPRTHVQYGGSGLGLFISRILTELQGGQIGVTSQKGVGSTFSFYIKSRKTEAPPTESKVLPSAPPLTRAPGSSTTIETRQPKASARDLLSGSAKASFPEPRFSEDGRRLFDVLIVEDNLVNQKVLQRSLRNVGNNTKVANHGGEALEILKGSRYWQGNESAGDDISIILMDLEMPVMDGITCARKIRELERDGTITSHIPIIAVTAYARPEQIENAKAAGVDDVISKPFRIPELIPRIEQLVEAHANYAETTAA